ncbi:LamG domain-containing protein [Amycolatopsis keratiniphila]|uniref:LamG domain-containing protein n=1 Tax=Amycolatopsis keratiniphila TaxID=129921 RepID=UPI001177928E|nr:LamG domain-containing protein [Amycolatopsis keratiniphila]
MAFGLFPATAFAYPGVAAAPAASVVPDSAPDTAAATQFAKQGRKKVRIDDLTTERSESFANPDGSVTLTRNTRPVRVPRDGGWIPADSTLSSGPNGLSPKAAMADISLSAGRRGDVQTAGTAPLLQLSAKDTSVGLDWPGVLPQPVVSGATATYPEVLPGVDLKVEVDVDKVHEVVVIKTPEAAKHPAIAKIKLGVPVKNGKLTKDDDGTLRVKDAKGADVFLARAPLMWDSSGAEPDATDFVRGPAAGGRQAKVQTEISGKSLLLTPDAGLLANAAYPVYVDPTWQTNYCSNCGRNHYLVQYACGASKAPGDAVWDSDANLKAGYIYDSRSSCAGNLVTARSFVEMNLGGLGGKLIYDASLTLAVDSSKSCELRHSNNLMVTNPIGPGLTFGSGPALGAGFATVSGCPTNVGFNITTTIKGLVEGGGATFTFGIISPSENDQNTWKRYSAQVGFTVTYNSRPNAPFNLAIVNGTATYPCAPYIPGMPRSRPVLGRTSTGYVVKANVRDPDGGMLYAGFRVYKGWVSTGNYAWDGRQAGVDNVLSDSNVANRNAQATLSTESMNADGLYSYDAHVTDGRETSWSAACEVEVQLSAPAAPSVSSQTYPSGTFGGGPGRAGDFTFTVANTPTSVGSYVWKLDNTAPPTCNDTEPGTVKPAAYSGPATVAIAPPTKGTHVLSVWSCNRAKTPSTRTDYNFSVRDVTAPLASWQFEGNGASQATGLRYVGEGKGTFAEGKIGEGAVLSGQAGDYFATGARVLDTTKSFSVSAWVNPTGLTSRRVVLSQDGAQSSGFALHYHESGKWAFSIADSAQGSAFSTAAAAEGTWTHLTGVYDAAAKTATLYVNGQPQATVSTTGVGGAGPLVVGGGKSGGVRTYLYSGKIDETAVFDRALTATEVATLHGNNGVPTGLSAIREYALESNTVDATGNDGALTFAPGSGFATGYSDSAGQSATESKVGQSSGQAFVGAGTGYGQTKTPVIDTAQSFTVSAWAKLADTNDSYAVAGQDGVRSSGFQMGYSKDVNRWIIGLPAEDVDGDGYRWAIPTSVPQVGVWTHLTGVYDASTAKVLIYVNGVLEGQTAVPAGTTWTATGGFAVGRARWNGMPSTPFRGSIDQVQVWDRALPAAEAAGLANTAVLRANYQLDGSTIDGVTGAAGVVSGGAAMVNDNGVNVAKFDKSWSGEIESPRPPALRADRSFTVEAWVRHKWSPEDVQDAKLRSPSNSVGGDDATRAAVGLNDPKFSPFLLGYRPSKDAAGNWFGKWSWLTSSPSAVDGQPTPAVDVTSESIDENTWTHLTGTYDAVSDVACLYAETDERQFQPVCQAGVAGWSGNSDIASLFIGRGVWTGLKSDYWYGDVRGVRVYTGVLDAQRIAADMILDHP